MHRWSQVKDADIGALRDGMGQTAKIKAQPKVSIWVWREDTIPSGLFRPYFRHKI